MATPVPLDKVDTSSFTPAQMAAYQNVLSQPITSEQLAYRNANAIKIPTYSPPVFSSSAAPPPQNTAPTATSSASPTTSATASTPTTSSNIDFGIAGKQVAVNQADLDYKAALDKQGTQAQRTQELAQQSGFNDITKNIDDLYAQDVKYAADLQSIQAQMSNNELAQQGTATSEVGRQLNIKDLNYNGLQAQNTLNAQRAVNSAMIALSQNRQKLAASYIQDALDREFKPLESKIKWLEKTLSDNRDSLSKAEQNQLQYQITQQTRAYEEGQQNKKDIYTVMAEAAKNGADNATLAAIQNAKTGQEALAAAGTSLQAAPGTQVVETNGRKLLINSKTGQTIKDLGSSSSGNNNDYTFTNTQKNEGANKAGVDMATFSAYPQEVQNYYVSSSETQLKAIRAEFDAVKDGDKTREEVETLIEESNAPQVVKQHLKTRLGTIQPKNDKGFFAKSWDAIKAWLGGATANSTTSTTTPKT